MRGGLFAFIFLWGLWGFRELEVHVEIKRRDFTESQSSLCSNCDFEVFYLIEKIFVGLERTGNVELLTGLGILIVQCGPLLQEHVLDAIS